MFCPKCGNPMPDDARFCGKCGYSNVSSSTPAHTPIRKANKSGINWTVFLVMMLIGLLIIGGGSFVILSMLGVIDSDLFDGPSHSSSRDKDDRDDDEDEDEDEDEDSEDRDDFRPDEDISGEEPGDPRREPVDLEDLQWESVDGGIRLTNYTGSDTYVVIPDTIDGKKVISLGKAFSGNVTVQTIVLGSYFETLNLEWLDDCEALVRVEGPAVTDLTGELSNDHVQELILPMLEYLNLDRIDRADGLRYLYIPAVEYITALDRDLEEVGTWPAGLEEVVMPDMEYYRMGSYFDDEDLADYAPVGCLAMRSYLDMDSDDWEDLDCGKCYSPIDPDVDDLIFCDFFQKDTIIVNGVTYRLS